MTDPAKPAPEKLARPHQLKSLTPDQTVAALLRLAMEISVLRERVATQQALLEQAGVLTAKQADDYVPDSAQAQQRALARNQLIEQLIGDLS
ncbi:MAG: hypothetical protein AAF270_06655 [Pseudomonadota bacterium]